jgi:hypothetical protein
MSEHLLHVGLNKAGSTYLQAWFRAHPRMAYAPVSIGGFNGTHALREFAARGPDEDPAYYVTSDEDLTNAWMRPDNRLDIDSQLDAYEAGVRRHQARVCQILHDLFPTARVLIVTRGFRSYVASAYSEYVKHGGTLDLPEAATRFSAFGRQVLDLDNIIGLYAAAFGPERMLVLPYELLRDDERRFLLTIEAWLGLEHFECDLGRVNPSLSPEELYWYSRLSRLVGACASVLPSPYKGRVYHCYISRVTETNRFRRVIRALSRISSRRVTVDAVPPECLAPLRGKATSLEHNPLYAPYSAEYLWERA